MMVPGPCPKTCRPPHGQLIHLRRCLIDHPAMWKDSVWAPESNVFTVRQLSSELPSPAFPEGGSEPGRKKPPLQRSGCFPLGAAYCPLRAVRGSCCHGCRALGEARGVCRAAPDHFSFLYIVTQHCGLGITSRLYTL